MSPLYSCNEWSDVNIYYNIGKAIFNGQVLYLETFDHKGPLIFFIYGIGYLISNSSFLGVYLILVILWSFFAFATFYTARLYLNHTFSFLVAILTPIIMLTYMITGGSAEEFIAILMGISMFFFIRYFKNKDQIKHKPSHMLLHGMLSTAVLLIKINLVIFYIFPLAAIFLNILLHKEYRNFTSNVIAFLGGVLLIFFPIYIYFYINNALEDAWNAYITTNLKYAQTGERNILNTTLLVIDRLIYQAKVYTLDVAMILVGVFYFPIKHIQNNLGKAVIILSFISLYFAIKMGALSLPYYNIVIGIFIPLALISILHLFNQQLSIKSNKYLCLSFAICAICIGIFRTSFFGLSTSELLRIKKENTVGVVFSEIISHEKDQTVFCTATDIDLCLFTITNITPSVKFFFAPNLTETVYPDLRKSQTEYIKNKETMFISICNHSIYYNYFMNLPILQENYSLICEHETNNKIFYLFKRKEDNE